MQRNKTFSKSSSARKRLLLFDPSSKNDLIAVCDPDLVHLNLEKNPKEEEEEIDEVSLDFERNSDDDDDEFENLPEDETIPNPELRPVVPLPDEDKHEVKKSTGCGSCNVKFKDVAEQRLHYTLDWHRYNVKRKLNGEECVNEARFNEMIDDLSSIDGSEDEEEAGQLDRLMDKLSTRPVDAGSSEVPAEQLFLSTSQKLEKSPKIFFKNSKGEVISCYKCILMDKRQDSSSEKNLVSNFLRLVKDPLKITIIMASGGHFAAAVFNGSSCTNHKTFHSYTVRAKQGGSQGSRDSKSATSHPKSAGASLRRYNEQSFSQHVQDLMESWKASISESDIIFYRAVSSNSNVLFGGKSPPLSKDNEKLRTIPFPTKRPTFKEVKRVHSLLTTLHVYDSFDSFLTAHSHLVKETKPIDASIQSPSKSKNKKTVNRAKSRSPKRKDDEDLQKNVVDSSDNETEQIEHVDQEINLNDLKEYDDSLTPEQREAGRQRKKKSKKKAVETFKLGGLLKELADSLEQKRLDEFQNLLAQVRDSEVKSVDLNEAIDQQSTTLLHAAVKSNLLEIVWKLMESGCDPALKDKSGKYPYNYAESRECRDTFRKFMKEYPEKYDYRKAQVPPPLTEEMEKERAEKKKLLNKLKREKEKQKKAERKEKEKETEEQRRFLNLSDREKRALAAEQRILAQCKKNSEKPPVLVRCFDCATDITGKVPFEYNNNLFCSPKCLAAHRKKFPCPLSV